MAIKINAGFSVGAKLYIDEKQHFTTKAEMASYNPNLIPNGFIAFCDEDNANYQWLDLNDVDVELNKWRKFTVASDVIDDSLTESLTKTYSISKIKELMKTIGGFVVVDALPNLTVEAERDTVETNKIYLVPKVGGSTGNEKEEYACIHIEATPNVYREALVTSEPDWTSWKAEIKDYVDNSGGSLTDDFATYSAVKTTTTLTETTYAEMIESINASDTDYATYTSRVTAIIVTPATPESWSWELIGSIDGVNLVFDDFTPNHTIGKVKAGVSLLDKEVIQVLKDMLTEDIKTTIKLTGNPSATILNEKGVSVITDVALTAVIELGTGTIDTTANVIFKKSGIAISTQPYQEGVLTYTYTDTGANLTNNETYSVEVAYTMDGAGDVATDEITYEFALPMYYGVSTTSTIADVTTLTKIVSANAKQTLSYTSNNAYLVFAIPDTKSITTLKDVNNFENIDSWSYTTQAVTIGADSVVYKVYVSNTSVTCTNFNYVATLA